MTINNFNELSVVEKIKVIMGREGISFTDLAEVLGTSKQNLHNKMKRGDLRQSEIDEIAKALNVRHDPLFTLSDGSEV